MEKEVVEEKEDLLSIVLKDPDMNIENMSMKNLNIFVGANGSGKTFVLITTFVQQQILQNIYQIGQAGIPTNKGLELEIANLIVQTSFEDPTFTGYTELITKHGNSIKLTFEKGEVTDIDTFLISDKVVDPVYLSSNTRQFAFIEMYLKFRKRLNGTNKQLSESAGKQLLEDYKLYDLKFIERMIARSPIKNDKDLADHFTGFKDNPVDLDVDLDTCKFFAVLADNSVKTCTKYSAGEQAIIIMFLAVK